QERGFFNEDTNYFITKFKELRQRKLVGGFKSYYEFLTYLFERISGNVEAPYYEDEVTGKVVVVGPAVFLNGEWTKAISIPDKCFYKEEITDILINTPAKKVNDEIPLLNLFESRDWTEGNIDEFVLGAIYEKLITYMERKKLGAYYTPEEITSYICKNTIEPYLVEKINEKFNKDFDTIEQIIESNEKDMILHLFEELKEIKILDPAVGSGHFLESAINVLVNVYREIWEKAKELGIREGMKILVADKRGEITEINLLEISDEDEFKLLVKFFIILSRNIYGVDINPSALKIARARLFLTLAKHFKVNKEKDLFIRFPNVHFNLREGNALVGYVEWKREKPRRQVKLDFFLKKEETNNITKRIKVVSELKPYLQKMSKALKIDGDIVKEIENLNIIFLRKNINWNEFETVLKTKEKLVRILVASLNSQYARPLNQLLNGITELFNQKLNERFAEEHSLTLEELKKTKTFHWIFEFPEVFSRENPGFDVIIGNPPYVELSEVEYAYLLDNNVKNLYDAFIRLSINMLRNNGMFGFIHANSAYCQPKFKNLRKFLYENANDFIIINFAIRPQPVFKGVMQRTAITICRKDPTKPKTVRTSRYIRLTEKNRSQVLQNPPIYDSSDFAFKFDDFIPKIGNETDYRIFRKLFSNSMSLKDIIDHENGVPTYYHDSGESYWTKALNYEPKGIRNGQKVKASHWMMLKVKPKYADFVLCAINSTLFYWFWLTVSDCRDLTKNIIKQFPIPPEKVLTSDILEELEKMARKLMKCYEQNSYYVEKRKGYKSLEFKVNRCKKLVNEIDKLIGKIYGLDYEEIKYLIEYDKDMRTED
ncbi:MAG: Eco57I restriction-modification methylase domain-containing protein, partial [Candidatus Heimdallarchaeaceae archaeon]